MAFPLPLLRNCPADPNDLRSLCLKARDVFFLHHVGCIIWNFWGNKIPKREDEKKWNPRNHIETQTAI